MNLNSSVVRVKCVSGGWLISRRIVVVIVR